MEAHRYLQVLYSTPIVIAAVWVLLWQKAVRSTALRTHHLEELKSFNRAAMIKGVMRTKSLNCWVLSRCFLYVLRPEVVWLPVLQLSKTEDTYARLRGAMFGSQFQSPFLGSSGMRVANRNDRQYKFPIFNTSVNTLLYKCKHSYTTAVNVLYNTDIPAYIPPEARHKAIQQKCQNKKYMGCHRQPLKDMWQC